MRMKSEHKYFSVYVWWIACYYDGFIIEIDTESLVTFIVTFSGGGNPVLQWHLMC